MAITVTLLLCLLLIVIIRIFFFGRKSRLQHFPAPKGVPLLGNAGQIDRQRPHLTFANWTGKYGDVYALRLLGSDALVLNSYQDIHEALVTKGHDYGGRMQTYRLDFLSEGCQEIFLSDMSPKWNLLRKTVHKQIKMYDLGLNKIESVNMGCIEELVKELKRKSGEFLNPKMYVYHTVFNIMMHYILRKKFDHTSKEFALFQRAEEIIFRELIPSGQGFELDLFPWLRYFGNKTYKELITFQRISDELYGMLKKQSNSSNGENVISSLMKLLNNNDSITEVCVKTTVMDILFAGVSSTSETFYALLNILLNYPKVQHKLRDEVDRVVGASRKVTMNDRDSMPYTRATILETLRYTSIVAVGVPHKTLKKTTLQGKEVPPGVLVFTNLFAMHHDERFWKAPYEFNPERFLNDDGEVLDPSTEERRRLMPFGAGTRVCLGEVLAMGRLFLLVATFAQMFEMEPGPIKVSADPRCYEQGQVIAQPAFELSLKVRNNQLFND